MNFHFRKCRFFLWRITKTNCATQPHPKLHSSSDLQSLVRQWVIFGLIQLLPTAWGKMPALQQSVTIKMYLKKQEKCSICLHRFYLVFITEVIQLFASCSMCINVFSISWNVSYSFYRKLTCAIVYRRDVCFSQWFGVSHINMSLTIVLLILTLTYR